MVNGTLIEKFRECGYAVETGTVSAAIRAYEAGNWLLLHGDPGTGKTFFFKCLADMGKNIEIWSAQTVATWNQDYVAEMLHEAEDAEIVIDDLGNEGFAKNYGTRYDPILQVLNTRVNELKRIHFTTNFTGAFIKERYIAAFVDRLKYFTPFAFEGVSRRTKLVTPPVDLEQKRKEAERKARENEEKLKNEWRKQQTLVMLRYALMLMENLSYCDADEKAKRRIAEEHITHSQASALYREAYMENERKHGKITRGNLFGGNA